MAFAFAAATARDASDWALHFHGGYGFMLEYDIQLYYRRARAWANVVMSPAAARRRVADLRYGSPIGAEPGSAS
jgi:alkylation response protein AidB-like acyl-CoA dehydrogenase